MYAYRHGEFGQVYPLARGLPPVLVTVFAFGVLGEHLTGGQVAGVGVVAFATVLWALSEAPLALVSAVRECSLLFAGVISVLVFHERLTATRLVATVAAAAGIVLVQVT